MFQQDKRKWEKGFLTFQDLELKSCSSFPTSSMLFQGQEEAPGIGEFEGRSKDSKWPSIISSLILTSVLRTGEHCPRADLKGCELVS